MTMLRSAPLALVCALALTVSACGGGGGSDAPAMGNVAGQWTAPSSVPGNSLRFTLMQDGSTVSGTGTFAGEAGPSGTVTVSGSVQGSSVVVTLQFSATVPVANTFTETFIGTLVQAGVMQGTLTGSFGQQSQEFDRQGG